ncbi:MAG: hypothetical protein EB120_00720, partial [Proteobacteria bacterium]|nr:hypothetical protein [Pseudomonadota bacterium]
TTVTGSPSSPAGSTNSAPSSTSGPVTAELEGGVKITSDAATNSLVITANSNDYKTLRKVIQKLDIPRLQVLVETAILEVNIDTSDKFGVNAVASNTGQPFAGGIVNDSDTLTKLATGGLVEGATIPLAGSGAELGVASLSAVINLLSKNTNTTVLSTPQILALDNEKAEFQVLDDTPVISGTTFSSASAVSSVSVERLKTGINIKLTPHVNAASRTIRMEIEQKVDSAKEATSVPLELQNKNKAITSRVTNTSVVVRDGDYLMMGGLMSDKVDDTISKVPLLGDIPILGWLFKSKTHRTLKTNLIIMLKPKIITTSVMAGNVIKESLQKRRQFIEENLSEGDSNEKDVGEIENRVDEQLKQTEMEPFERYRNNDDMEEDRSANEKPAPPAPELIKPKLPEIEGASPGDGASRETSPAS